MPPVAGGIEGEFQGRVYPVVIGLKAGPRTLHLCGEGTTHEIKRIGDQEYLIVTEPSGAGAPNLLWIPLENVAFIGQPMFLIETPTK